MGINFRNSRILASLVIVVSVLVLFLGSLFTIQIVHHDEYLKKSLTTNVYEVPIVAARGEIVDRNGNPLVVNRQGNAVIIDYAYFPPSENNDERNKVIIELIRLFEKNNIEWINELPLIIDANGNVQYAPDSDKEIAKLKSKEQLHLATYATAQNCFDALIEKYGVKGYNKQETLKICAVRYEMSLKSFSMRNPVTIAEDVPENIVMAVKEGASTIYKGADIQVVPYREYVDGTIAPHILGTTTKMTAELYAELKDDGYGMNDIVGESGIEKAMESYLRGTNGKMRITVDNDGNVKKEVIQEPVQGCTIVLTIDKNLQKVAQDSLQKVVDSVSPTDSAGAVVVRSVNNGEILAAASNPTYNIATYRDDYDTLKNDPRMPLWNRFAQGTYAPGSTFKPNTALALLEEGVITKDTTYVCHGKMMYKGREFRCLDGHAHGTVNVEEALEKSCNLFFYYYSDILGIQKMNEYSSDLGFGQKTGVEISEAKGILGGKAYTESIGGTWLPGFTLQSAIGQGDNLFTPLQLASYCATIANGGTRYQQQFVKEILSYDCSKVVASFQPTVLEKLDVHESSMQTIHNGMRRVAANANIRYIFNQLKVPVSAKTGTSQVDNPDGTKRNNGFLITFAPSDKPELAIASVVELAGSGTQTAAVTKDVIEYYYSTSEYSAKPQLPSQILG